MRRKSSLHKHKEMCSKIHSTLFYKLIGRVKDGLRERMAR